MTKKFYYMHYDNAKYNTVNAQALYKQYPPTFEETERKWKMDRFKSRQCRNAANVSVSYTHLTLPTNREV